MTGTLLGRDGVDWRRREAPSSGIREARFEFSHSWVLFQTTNFGMQFRKHGSLGGGARAEQATLVSSRKDFSLKMLVTAS